MSARREDLLELAGKIRYDLTAAQGKLSELLRQIAALPDDGSDSEVDQLCPYCGPCLWIKGPKQLAEHIRTCARRPPFRKGDALEAPLLVLPPRDRSDSAGDDEASPAA